MDHEKRIAELEEKRRNLEKGISLSSPSFELLEMRRQLEELRVSGLSSPSLRQSPQGIPELKAELARIREQIPPAETTRATYHQHIELLRKEKAKLEADRKVLLMAKETLVMPKVATEVKSETHAVLEQQKSVVENLKKELELVKEGTPSASVAELDRRELEMYRRMFAEIQPLVSALKAGGIAPGSASVPYIPPGSYVPPGSASVPYIPPGSYVPPGSGSVPYIPPGSYVPPGSGSVPYQPSENAFPTYAPPPLSPWQPPGSYPYQPEMSGMPMDEEERRRREKEELERMLAEEMNGLAETEKPKDTRSEEMKKKLAELERQKQNLLAPTMTKEMTANLSAKEEELKRLESQLASDLPIEEQVARRNKVKAELQAVTYGIDVVFILDCTGSMGDWIEESSRKIMELTTEVKQIKSTKNPHIRIGFVGYRDIKDKERFIITPFFEMSNQSVLSDFKNKLGAIQADGGGDTPEDIYGAIQKALEMEWRASTKLMILFTDAPCHGKQYHNHDDDYPRGYPENCYPEQLFESLISKSINFYFGEINESVTRKMRLKFEEYYASQQKSECFKCLPLSETSQFLPKFVNSIKDSMMMSGMFGL